MNWIAYDRDKWDNQPLPPERRHVLLQIEAKPALGLPPAVAVGYLKYGAGEVNSPYFVIPGVGGSVMAWCDCLGDDFAAPLWGPRKSLDPRHSNHAGPDRLQANPATKRVKNTSVRPAQDTGPKWVYPIADDPCTSGTGHSDPDNSGVCIYCGAVLDPD